MKHLELIALMLSGLGTIIVILVTPAPSRGVYYKDEEEIVADARKDRCFRKFYWLGSGMLIVGVMIQFVVLINK